MSAFSTENIAIGVDGCTSICNAGLQNRPNCFVQSFNIISSKEAANLTIRRKPRVMCSAAYPLIVRTTTTMTNVIKRSQTVMMTPAATQFLGLSWLRVSCAFSLHSSKTVLGIIFSTRVIPRGTKTRSSKYPKAGMKSGIRSIGLKAYPTTQAANTLAYQGTLGSLQAK